MVTITAKTASEYAASRSAVSFSSRIARSLEWARRRSALITYDNCPEPLEQRWDFHASRGRGELTVRTPTFSLEVITLPVSDVERALRFYVDQVGFTLDVDYSPNDEAARSLLLEREVEVGEIRHTTPIGAWDGGFAPGLDVDHAGRIEPP